MKQILKDKKGIYYELVADPDARNCENFCDAYEECRDMSNDFPNPWKDICCKADEEQGLPHKDAAYEDGMNLFKEFDSLYADLLKVKELTDGADNQTD